MTAFDFEKWKIKILDFFEVKQKMVLILLLILGFIAVIFPSSIRMVVPANYNYDKFSSNYCDKNDEKIINNDSVFNGIFIYGPYIDIKKGTYTGIVKYKTDIDVRYELTSGFGADVIKQGVLSKDNTEEKFEFVIDDDINDNSIELRLYYEGRGNLEFEKFGYVSNVFNFNALITAIAMTIVYLLIFFVVKENKYFYSLYCLFMYIFLSGFLAKNVIFIFLISVILALLVVFIFGRKNFNRKIKNIKAEEIVSLLLSSFMIISIIFMKVISGGSVQSIDYVAYIDGSLYIALYILILHIALVIRLIMERQEFTYVLMFVSSFVFGIISILDFRNIYFACGIIAVLGYFNYYLLRNDKLGLGKLNNTIESYKPAYVLVGAGFVVFSVLFSYITISRYKMFSASCYDFGIFAQMYDYMATTGMPLTTCERGYLMSHFYVHFSPIYYIFLPIYMIVRMPQTLLVIQSVMVFAAVIPLFMILKSHKVKPVLTVIICYIYMLAPAIVQPLLFDFHENKFIPFFMLWLIYCLENKKIKATYIFLILTLMIKEDTSIYIMIIALYFIISGKNVKHGVISLIVSVIYFIAVMAFIQANGMGLMEGHYGLYYLKGQDGIVPMIRNILYAPGFFVKNVFAEENFEYIIYTIGSLLFIPMINKDLKNLILLIPFVAFGLMTDYTYQHDIGYQYTYGLMIIMIYLFIININGLSDEFKNIVCLTSLCAVVILSVNYRADTLTYYPDTYKSNESFYEAREDVLDKIPENVSITVNTFILPHLYDYKELYMFDDNYNETDYYILDSGNTDEVSAFENSELYAKYEKCYEGFNLKIYKLPEASDLMY